MTENMKRFMEAVENDRELREKLEDLKDIPAEEQAKALFELAQAKGIALSEQDLMPESCAELSDDELEGAAGGGVSTQILSQVAARVIAEAIEKEKRRQAMS